ncbi:ribonuclease II, chloroplastic/mitochondrial isoform X3 [Malus domestica]|uniref:ribonuclease II, chloroplastic/mitochondrial isoform X3 n=1 Tax=Malus domestica TaxID=3750 RepID=UPI0010AA5798|nr:ribonuclease II, chloroplastic/mitochondrial isoform X3 [Malus domestica]
MAVRAVGSSTVFRSASSSASSPTLLSFRCCPCRFTTLQFRRFSKLGIRFPIFRSGKLAPGHGGVQSTSVHSLVNSVMEELGALRRRRLVRAAAKVELTSSGGIVEDKLVSWTLQQGLLLEFKKDAERVLLAIAQKPDGKKNWMVSDQNGVTSSIKPQQITYIVPGVENFDHTEISDFIQKAQDNLDPALLEFAWVELLEKNKRVTAEELAEMIFGTVEPLECYCAHLLLSEDEVYFTVLETKGSRSIYGPRPASQVEELLCRKLAKEAAEKELQEFKQLLKSAKAMPLDAKPLKSSWLVEEKTRHKIESLEAYAIDACTIDDQRKTAGTILRTMGMVKTASSALNLLIDIGYFPVHVNLELLKLNIRTDHSDEVISSAERLLSGSSDSDEIERRDLTHLKVYAIDVDEADELDDALSAMRLQDGRIKIWIHVADATRFLQPGSIVDREAMRRGTSVFLPTATYPMFPEKLAMEGMSLQQGEICNAVTVSVVLHSDGSIAEYSVDNSIIKPTYMLTYESASELLHLNLQEEAELKILSEAATLRSIWRREQVKAFLAGESLPFSAGQLEGMASVVNMNVRVARRLFSSSLRYWILEYLRRQPKEKKYRALILRFIKDRIAAILLVEVGLQSSVWVSVGAQIGDEVLVRVEEAHPRDDVLLLKEVVI